jgi:uncharacterized protein (TIGR03435 family)
LLAGSSAKGVGQIPAGAAPATAAEVHAKGDLAGSWQGTINTGRSTRAVLKIAKGDKGWEGKIFVIFEQGAQPINVSKISLDGSAFKFSVEQIGGSYEGTLSPDGTTIVGTLTGGGPQPQPVTFVRATKETAWEIPGPPPPPKLMPANADPSFDVATIKPNNSGATTMQGLTVNGRNFRTRASSLADLIAFAYEVQSKQIVNAPDWITKDRYDIDAVPDVDGAPNPAQVRSMIKKLLADRFQLKFHHEQKELSAYVLTVAKGGQKLTPTEMKGPLPGIGLRPSPSGLTIPVRNAEMKDFTGFLQIIVLDRPVVDRTGIKGRYDFQISFTPDDSEFNGHPPPTPAKTDATEPFPTLFEALEKQDGLQLEAMKTPVDVLAIDKVEKPSAN